MRDYSKEPNRFSFKLLYNNEPVVTVDNYGNQRASERDFDSPFNEFTSVKDSFENSWESVELGEEISKIFRLILKQGTEQFLYSLNKAEKTLFLNEIIQTKDLDKIVKDKNSPTQELREYERKKDEWFKAKKNTFTFVIVDRKSLIRDEYGYFPNLRSLYDQIDTYKEKIKFNKITSDELSEYKSLQKELAKYYTEKEIFKCDISADDFSYNGKDFTPPISIIWKDFNINYSSPRGDQSNIEYDDISNFSMYSEKAFNIKNKIEKLKEYLNEMEKIADNIKIASIEADIRKYERELSKVENVYFLGIRSLIKDYFNRENYTNRFLINRMKNNNKYVNSSEVEIIQEAIYL